MRLIRQPLHSCAHKIRYALGVLRGPSRDFADKKVFSAPSASLRGQKGVLRGPPWINKVLPFSADNP